MSEVAHSPNPPSDRRKYARQRPHSLTYVELDQGNGGIILDASESGISVQAVVSIAEDDLPQIRLKLDDSKAWLQARARVVWTREARKVAGLEFEELCEDSLVKLKDWLSREAWAEPAGAEQVAPPQTEQEERTAVSEAVPDAIEAAEFRSSPLPVDSTNQSGGDLRLSMTGAAISELPLAAKTFAQSILMAPKSAPQIERVEKTPVHAREDEITRAAVRRQNVHRAAPLYVLLFVLAIVSLTAGWAAGRGKFDPAARKLRTWFAPRRSAVRASHLQPLSASLPVSEIEIVDATNRQWTIPLQAVFPAPDLPLPARPVASKAPTREAEPTMNFRIWTLSAPQRSASSEAGTSTGMAPPTVNDRPNSPEIAPIAPGNSNAVPKPEIYKGELQRGILRHRVEPEYPALAREQRISGTVVLDARVGIDGEVRTVNVVSGPQLLIPAAINAVREWRYSPTLLDGKPIETDVRVSLEFHLPSGGE